MEQTPEITAILKALENDILNQKPKATYTPYSTNDVQLQGSIWIFHQ